MSKRQNLLAVWQQIPVANRTVGAAASVTGAVGSVTTVSDKTGYSLTAGSYSVRASSTQYGYIQSAATSATATISSVTTTRAVVNKNGNQTNNTSIVESDTDFSLTNATTVTSEKGAGTGTVVTRFAVLELF